MDVKSFITLGPGWVWIQQSEPQETDQAESGHPDSTEHAETQHDSARSGSGESESVQIHWRVLSRISGWTGVLADDHGKPAFYIQLS